ncbi:MAG: MotA/TolQ/ExbB proton channel family protein [Pseudomonadota bacterium]
MSNIQVKANDSSRLFVFLAALGFGVLWIAALTFSLDEDGFLAAILLDRNGRFPYPVTIQNVMWMIFFIGLGELLLRSWRSRRELQDVDRGFLPEDDETMLRAKDLAPFASKVRSEIKGTNSFLLRMILRVIWQFQASRDVSQASEVMNMSQQLFHDEIEIRYNMIRYITWLIPTLGFVGTVIGIAFALEVAGDPPDVTASDELRDWMRELTRNLGVAFNTTLVALLQSAFLVFLMHLSQEQEELALNRSSQYCLDNLINRLYDK